MDMNKTLAMLNEGREEMKMYRYKNQDLILGCGFIVSNGLITVLLVDILVTRNPKRMRNQRRWSLCGPALQKLIM
jgi:hypothetical protein